MKCESVSPLLVLLLLLLLLSVEFLDSGRHTKEGRMSVLVDGTRYFVNSGNFLVRGQREVVDCKDWANKGVPEGLGGASLSRNDAVAHSFRTDGHCETLEDIVRRASLENREVEESGS